MKDKLRRKDAYAGGIHCAIHQRRKRRVARGWLN